MMMIFQRKLVYDAAQHSNVRFTLTSKTLSNERSFGRGKKNFKKLFHHHHPIRSCAVYIVLGYFEVWAFFFTDLDFIQPQVQHRSMYGMRGEKECNKENEKW